MSDLYANYQKNLLSTSDPVAGFRTRLSDSDEREFRAWVKENNAPTDPQVATQDYDMRGFWLAQRAGAATTTTNDGKTVYPPQWRTPYHAEFTSDSVYAKKESNS